MRLALSFSIVRCECGEERLAGQRCDSCGCDPSETDADLDRRRALLAVIRETHEARGNIADEPQQHQPVSLETVWHELTESLGGLLSAFERSNDDSIDEAAERLLISLSTVELLRLRVSDTPRRRPTLVVWKAVERVLALEAQLADRYLSAIVAPTPADAEEAAADAQLLLDEAAAIAGRFSDVVDARFAVDEADLGDEYGDVIAGARAAFSLANATNLVDFEAKGVELWERITGSSECPVGFGIRLQMLNLIVESSFDEDRFWQSAQHVYRSLGAALEPFALLVQDESWQRDFAAVAREARDAGIEAAAIGIIGANRRRDLRAGIRLGAVVSERLGPPLVATLLAVKRRSAYARERSKDVRTLLQEGRNAGLGELLQGIDLALRDADAHGAFEIREGGVAFSGTRREYDFLGDEELLDRVLLGFESVFAFYIGIAAALPAAGFEPERLDLLLAEKPAMEDGVRVVLALNGWSDVVVERAGATLRIRGTRHAETATGVPASLLPVLDEDVEELVLQADGLGRARVARGPLEPFRRGAEQEDPAEKHAASIEALASWTIDGRAPIARSTLRKVVAVTALQAFDPEKSEEESLSTLRTCVALVDRLAARGLLRDRLDRRLQESVRAALALREHAAAGVSHTDAQRVADALTRLAPERVPNVRVTW
jgi:hypothetical protein